MDAKRELAAFRICGARPYETVREECHGVKNGYVDVIESCARRLAQSVPEKAVLIPIPGRFGYADSSYGLAQEIQRLGILDGKRVVLRDALYCDAHEPLYDIKKRGETRPPDWLRMRPNKKMCSEIVALREEGYAVVFVDNVIDTGTTMVAAKRALHLKFIKPGSAFILTVGASPQWF